jgi:hypothetical protein
MIAQTLQKSFPTAAYSLATVATANLAVADAESVAHTQFSLTPARDYERGCTQIPIHPLIPMLDTNVPIIEVESSATMSYWLSLSMITISYIRLAVSGCAATLSSLSRLVSPLITLKLPHVETVERLSEDRGVSEVVLPDHLISLVFIGSTNNFLFG